MNYCEDCKLLCGGDECPNCESTFLRQVRDEDYCFLTECTETMGKMLKYAFDDMEIPCALMPFGNGARSALGLNLGNYVLFVPYRHYEQAMDVVEGLSYNPTEDLRQNLLENEDKWHIQSKFTQRRMRKKLKVADDGELIACIRQGLTQAEQLTDNGPIGSCPEGGHYVVFVCRGIKIWFNSSTYEMIL